MDFLETTIENGWGIITLNRRQALNALNFDMVLKFSAFLTESESNPNIQGILIQSALPHYFCVGGDIKEIYLNYQNNRNDISKEFLEAEYSLNLQLANFTKPSVVLIDGLNLGGGVGVSRYAKYRVITENAKIGMPEVKIGFFPDVGAGYFLNKLPISIANFLALTGYLVEGTDALETKFGTHYIQSDSLLDFKTELLSNVQNIEPTLKRYVLAPPKSTLLKPHAKIIDFFFNKDSLETTILKITESSTPFAKDLSKALQDYSPLALKIIWKYIQITRNMDHEQVMQLDKKLANSFLKKSDFIEGIRTKLIAKNDTPTWIYHSFSSVSSDVLAEFFSSDSKIIR